jgi:hypothetical protein
MANPPAGIFPVEGSKWPIRGVKMDEFDVDKPSVAEDSQAPVLEQAANRAQKQLEDHPVQVGAGKRGGKKAGASTEAVIKLRILVVEVGCINFRKGRSDFNAFVRTTTRIVKSCASV